MKIGSLQRLFDLTHHDGIGGMDLVLRPLVWVEGLCDWDRGVVAGAERTASCQSRETRWQQGKTHEHSGKKAAAKEARLGQRNAGCEKTGRDRKDVL